MNHTRILIQRLQALDVPNERRNEYLCTAIASAISGRSPLPTSPVKSISSYYNDHHRRRAVEIVNAINEDIVFDVKEALELTQRLYSLRYAFVYTPETMSVGDSLIALMGTDRTYTPVKYKALLSDPTVAKVASEVRQTVAATLHNMVEEDEHDIKAPETASGA